MWKCANCGANNPDTVIEDCRSCGAGKEIYGRTIRQVSIGDASTNIKKRPNEAVALAERYSYAYFVARALDNFGNIIRKAGLILFVVIVIGTFIVEKYLIDYSQAHEFSPISIMVLVLGLCSAIGIGTWFFISGHVLEALGHILKASIDCAVNSSPFLENEERAKIMSLLKSS